MDALARMDSFSEFSNPDILKEEGHKSIQDKKSEKLFK